MPILHSPGVMTPGQLGPIKRQSLALHVLLDLDHVEDRHAFGDADDQFDTGFDRFHDGIGAADRRYVDDRSSGAGRFDGIFNRIKDRETVDLGAALAGGDSANHLGAVVAGALGMEQAGGAGDPLGNHPGIFID